MVGFNEGEVRRIAAQLIDNLVTNRLDFSMAAQSGRLYETVWRSADVFLIRAGNESWRCISGVELYAIFLNSPENETLRRRFLINTGPFIPGTVKHDIKARIENPSASSGYTEFAEGVRSFKKIGNYDVAVGFDSTQQISKRSSTQPGIFSRLVTRIKNWFRRLLGWDHGVADAAPVFMSVMIGEGSRVTESAVLHEEAVSSTESVFSTLSAVLGPPVEEKKQAERVAAHQSLVEINTAEDKATRRLIKQEENLTETHCDNLPLPMLFKSGRTVAVMLDLQTVSKSEGLKKSGVPANAKTSAGSLCALPSELEYHSPKSPISSGKGEGIMHNVVVATRKHAGKKHNGVIESEKFVEADIASRVAVVDRVTSSPELALPQGSGVANAAIFVENNERVIDVLVSFIQEIAIQEGAVGALTQLSRDDVWMRLSQFDFFKVALANVSISQFVEFVLTHLPQLIDRLVSRFPFPIDIENPVSLAVQCASNQSFLKQFTSLFTLIKQLGVDDIIGAVGSIPIRPFVQVYDEKDMQFIGKVFRESSKKFWSDAVDSALASKEWVSYSVQIADICDHLKEMDLKLFEGLPQAALSHCGVKNVTSLFRASLGDNRYDNILYAVYVALCTLHKERILSEGNPKVPVPGLLFTKAPPTLSGEGVGLRGTRGISNCDL